MAAGSDPHGVPCDWGLKEDLRGALEGDGGGVSSPEWSAIPLLSDRSFNAGGIRNHTLVRYVGMVQDMHEPEFFASCVRAAGGEHAAGGVVGFVNSSFADVLGGGPGGADHDPFGAEDGGAAVARERLPLFCVPVPTDSAWARPREQRPATVAAAPGAAVTPSKRGLDTDKTTAEEEVEGEMAAAWEAGGGGGGDEAAGMEDGSELPALGQRPKRAFAAAAAVAAEATATRAPGLAFFGASGASGGPAGGPQLCCLVKLYDADVERAGLKLNDVVREGGEGVAREMRVRAQAQEGGQE